MGASTGDRTRAVLEELTVELPRHEERHATEALLRVHQETGLTIPFERAREELHRERVLREGGTSQPQGEEKHERTHLRVMPRKRTRGQEQARARRRGCAT